MNLIIAQNNETKEIKAGRTLRQLSEALKLRCYSQTSLNALNNYIKYKKCADVYKEIFDKYSFEYICIKVYENEWKKFSNKLALEIVSKYDLSDREIFSNTTGMIVQYINLNNYNNMEDIIGKEFKFDCNVWKKKGDKYVLEHGRRTESMDKSKQIILKICK